MEKNQVNQAELTRMAYTAFSTLKEPDKIKVGLKYSGNIVKWFKDTRIETINESDAVKDK